MLWVKIIDFSYVPKIIRILKSCSMKIFSTVNISKLNFWLVICIARNFIWTTLKMIFSIFRFCCTLRFQIFKQLYLFRKMDPYDWFCDPGSHFWCDLASHVNASWWIAPWWRPVLVVCAVNGIWTGITWWCLCPSASFCRCLCWKTSVRLCSECQFVCVMLSSVCCV